MEDKQMILDILCDVSNIFKDVHEMMEDLKEIQSHLRSMDESCNGIYSSSSVHCSLCEFKYKCKDEIEKESQY